MDQENLVQAISVEDDGQTYEASYFIERGIIHALVDGRSYLLPAGPTPAEEVIRSLLRGKLHSHRARAETVRNWYPDP